MNAWISAWVCVSLSFVPASNTFYLDLEVFLLLTERLRVSNCLLVTDASDISVVKKLSEANVFASRINLEKFSEYLLPKTLTLVLVNASNVEEFIGFLNKALLPPQLIWAVFLNSNTKWFINEISNISLGYDKQFFLLHSDDESNLKIDEIYQIKPGSKIIEKNLGQWDKKRNLTTTNLSLYSRRSNMEGFQLNLLIYYEERIGAPGEWIHCQIWMELAKIFNFTIGFLKRTEIQNLNDPQIDVTLHVVAYAGQLDERLKYMIGPTSSLKAYMHVRSQGNEAMRVPSYFSLLSQNMWLSVLCWCIACVVIATMTCGRLDKKSSYIARCSLLLLPFWLIPMYCAGLFSLLRTQVAEYPFKDLSGFLQDGTFRLSANQRNLETKYNRGHQHPDFERLVREFLVDEKFDKTMDEMVAKMCEDEKFAALIYNKNVYLNSTVCRIIQIPVPLFDIKTGMQLSKNSTFSRLFNKVFTRFRSSGVLHRMKLILDGEIRRSKSLQHQPVQLRQVRHIFVLLLSGFGVAFLFLVFEIIFKKLRMFCCHC